MPVVHGGMCKDRHVGGRDPKPIAKEAPVAAGQTATRTALQDLVRSEKPSAPDLEMSEWF